VYTYQTKISVFIAGRKQKQL